MMHARTRMLILAMLALSTAAHGAPARIADCEALARIDRNKTYEADERDIRQCIQRGWDPPVTWRNNEGRSAGVRVGGAGGFNTVRKPPERPPGAEGANANVSAALFGFTMGIPPWRGFPCQVPGGIDLCGGSNGNGSGSGNGTGDGTGDGTGGAGGGGGGSACPVANDTTGTYGTQQPVTGGNVSLTCGGAVPLSTYFMSATTSPIGIVATEAGSRQVWIYRANGGSFEQVATGTLPSYVCNDKGEQIPIQPPVAQIVQFSAGSANVPLRLSGEYGEEGNPFVNDPEAEPIRYLVLPIKSNIPEVPADCARDTAVFSTVTSLTAPLTIESAGTATCDSVTLPQGGACEGNILFAVLDRPNLIFTPGSSAGFTAMQGRTAFLAGTSSGTRLYAQADTIMYFGARGGSFTLPEGGVMKLDDGSRLVMNGPATINAGGRSVTLTGGGSIQSADGTTTGNYSAGSTASPAAALPYVVKVSRSVEMPAGITLPTQPAPFVRLPKPTGQ